MFTSFTAWVDSLLKAAGHKYIKRIPYQSQGKMRYRYIYHVGQMHHGKHVLDPDHMVEGAAFMLSTHAGKEVHAHILSSDGADVTYILDDGPRKGQKVTESKEALAKRLNDTHGVSAALKEQRAVHAKKIEDLRAAGASEKQLARHQARLAALGKDDEAPVNTNPSTKGTKSRSPATQKALALVKRYSITAAQLDDEKLFPTEPPKKLADGAPNPDYQLYMRLISMPGDREGLAKEHNKVLKRAAQELGDMGLWDLIENVDEYGSPKIDDMSPELESWLRSVIVFEAPIKHPKYELRVTGMDEVPEDVQALVDVVTRTIDKTSHLYAKHKGIGRLTVDFQEGRALCDHPKDSLDFEDGLKECKIRLDPTREPWRAIHEAVHLVEMFSGPVQTATLLSTIPRIKIGAHTVLKEGEEAAFADDFPEAYTGKMYRTGASEYLTMALQQIMHDPDTALQFAKQDPHSFITAYSILKGYHS